jgi:predicted Zn-dependent peptidase
MYGNNSLTNIIGGTEESINNISKEDITIYLKNTFPQDMTVVSCGGCDIKDIYGLFNQVLPYKNNDVTLETPLISGATRYGSKKIIDQKLVSCMFAFPTFGITSGGDVALTILASYLGRGRTSLLTELLRYNEGLLYSITAGNHRFSDAGFLFLRMSLKKENLKTVFTKINASLETLVKEGIPQEALNMIKNKIVNAGMISPQTVQFWTESQFNRELLVRDNNFYYPDFLNGIRDASKADLDTVINQYIRKENTFFYAVGNIEEDEVNSLFS